MIHSAARVITFHYTLRNSKGIVLDSSSATAQPLHVLEGARHILPQLEKALLQLQPGVKHQIRIAPDHGYGPRLAELIQEVPVDAFPEISVLETGMKFHMQTETGPRVVSVIDVRDRLAIIDANHPLAGETLDFELEVVNIRPASQEEQEAGDVLG